MKLSYRNFPFLKAFDKDYNEMYKTDLSSIEKEKDQIVYTLRDLYIKKGLYLNIPIYVMSDTFQSKVMEHKNKLSGLFRDYKAIRGALKPICFIYKMIIWTCFEFNDKYIFAAQNKFGHIWWWIEIKIDENKIFAISKECLCYNESEYKPQELILGFIALMLFKEYAPTETEVLNGHSKINKSVINEKAVNDTGISVKLLDSRWFREIIRTEGFTVSGHFRFQPCKDSNGEWTRKLIYINEFEKHGYHRRALHEPSQQIIV